MNTLIRTLAMALVIVAATTASSLASRETTAKKLLQELSDLESGAANPNRVNKLVVKLTKLYPNKAPRYYRIGLKRIPTSQPYAAQKMANSITEALESLGIPPLDAAIIEKTIVLALIDWLRHSATPGAQ